MSNPSARSRNGRRNGRRDAVGTAVGTGRYHSRPVPTVAFDATPLLGNRTGIGTCVAGWLDHLAATPDVSVRAFGLTLAGWRHLPAQLPPLVRPPRIPLPAGAMSSLWSRSDLVPIEWVTGRVGVVHGTNFVVPPARRAARVVTVWDLTCVRFPELCTPTTLRYPALISRAVTSGSTVHVTSQAVADEVREYFGADRDQVVVIAPGIMPRSPQSPTRAADASGYVTGVPAASGEVSVVARDDSVPPAAYGEAPARPYILALGTVEPRKDLPNLVRAFDAVAAAHPELELVIAGPSGWGEERLRAAVAQAAHRTRIRRIGWVADRDRLLEGAAVFAYPSIYEGFGLPPLEAMAAGVPVVTTRAGAIPEVVGDAALLVPVGDADALAAGLERALTDEVERRRLIDAGGRRVARYSWNRAGRAMVELYQRLATT